MNRTLLALCLLVTCVRFAPAQGSRSDYERATGLARKLQNKVFRTQVTPHWYAGNTRFWYKNDLPGGTRDFIRVDAEHGVREAAFDHEQLARAFTAATGKTATADRLPIDRLDLTADGSAFHFQVAGDWWRCDARTYHVERARTEPKVENDIPRRIGQLRQGFRGRDARSPDRQWTAVLKDHNVVLRGADGKEFKLTTDGTAGDHYTDGFYWAPDSKHLVVLRTRDAPARKVYLIESSPRDQLQPRLHSLDYRKPGDDIPLTRPHLFDVTAKKHIDVPDTLFPTPWEGGGVRWERDGKRFTFVYNQRGHQVLRIIGVDAGTGQATALVDEQSKTFVDYAHKQFAHYLDDTGELVWMSERDGWCHLYLYDLKTGKVKNQITKGPWVVRGVERVDPARRQVWFRAGGIRPGQDPYFIHYARVNFDGTGLTLLTEGDGTHTAAFSPDSRYLVDTYSRVDRPPVTELRRADDGKLLCTLERADASALEALGWRAPEPFVARGRDGVTDIYGVIWRPLKLDPARKYPVIEHIYAGPQGSFVPKNFRPYYPQMALAELGFVVVQMDGMGTSNRSKAFHDVCWKNLGDSGFPDRILWIKAAAEKYPYLDVDRVGLYGGSAGGQSTLRGLTEHGDFYKAGAADCGCHDNRMDKIWWNELWMGWPIGPHYAEQSNVTNAHKLKGKLLLTVGELDRNVDPASTMQVVSALIKANKDFELIVFPGGGHGSGSNPYGVRRMWDFFVRSLHHAEPRGEP